ncbi:MAG: DUF1835 domain-containing protein [Alphaproteobacteria bacterium]|nr:MAG: DUF1835 domain-containing protein [Alphaproteobacteria bacterium]
MALDSKRTLHIRCGQDIEGGLREAGFVGDFLDFSDPFCQGPVHDLPVDEFVQMRSAFIADAYGLPPDEVMVEQERRYSALDAVKAYDNLVLWFEHDHYDQLILAYLLKRLGELQGGPATELVCIDDYPVLPRFTGLGQLGPKDLLAIWEQRVPVGPAQYALGSAVWRALASPSPEGLLDFAQGGTPAVPQMAGAIDRHLSELPSSRHGLSLTETLSLRILAEQGFTSGGRMFAALMLRYEPRPYLGDLMYWYELDRLVRGGAAVIRTDADSWRDRVLALSPLGERILMTEDDWLAHIPAPRHVGGVVITRGKPAWRRLPRGGVKLMP